MPATQDTVFLFDVDDTLLDNDRFQDELRGHLTRSFGPEANDRYWQIFEELRAKLGYADYLGALECYRSENLHEQRLLKVSSWLLDYPFAACLYPGALDVVSHLRQWGLPVILSDGDAVYQPRKIERAGLWNAFNGHVLIYIHKEAELENVRRSYPARRYVLIDDKLRILDAIKRLWGERVTTVFPKQGHYARDPRTLAGYPAADVTVDRIAELKKLDFSAVLSN